MPYLLRGNKFLKNATLSRMSNFLNPWGDHKSLWGNVDWEAQLKLLRVNFVTRKCISL